GTMDNEVEARSERVCDHVRRSLAGIGNLLMENRRNTVKEIDPRHGDHDCSDAHRHLCHAAGLRRDCLNNGGSGP
ncbi:hypothetical protein AB0K68_48125, partial [Streptomyces sp. NPDC050698]